jgi:hypothetical protein
MKLLGPNGLIWHYNNLCCRAAIKVRSGRPRLSRRHISDDGLPAIVDVDVLDPNVLLAAMPKPSKNLDLCRIGSQQPCRGRSKGCDPSFGPMSPSEPGQDRHGGCMRACHLDR